MPRVMPGKDPAGGDGGYGAVRLTQGFPVIRADVDALELGGDGGSYGPAVHVLEGWFTPHVSGAHTFHLASAVSHAALYVGMLSADFAHPRVGAIANFSDLNFTRLIYRPTGSNGWGGMHDWFGCHFSVAHWSGGCGSQGQICGCRESPHPPLNLKAGRPVFLRLSHYASDHFGYQALGVRAPSRFKTDSSAGIQSKCSASALRELQILRVRPGKRVGVGDGEAESADAAVSREIQRIHLDTSIVSGGKFILLYEGGREFTWYRQFKGLQFETGLSEPIEFNWQGEQQLRYFGSQSAPVILRGLGHGIFDVEWRFARADKNIPADSSCFDYDLAHCELRPMVTLQVAQLECGAASPCDKTVFNVTRTQIPAMPLGGSFRLRLGIRQRWQFSDAFVDGLLLASYPMPHSVTSLPNRVSKFKVFLDWISYDGGDVEFASVAEAFSPDRRDTYLLDNVNCAS